MKLIFFAIVSALLIQSCGKIESDTKLLETKTFTFAATIDPSTLVQQQPGITISHSTSTLSSTYTIANSGDVSAFDSVLDSGEQKTFNDLDVFTYFLIATPACPEYFEYGSKKYNNGILSITANHFRVTSTLSN
jgi:hypothetical protein